MEKTRRQVITLKPPGVNGGEPLHSDEIADKVDDLQSLVLGMARA